MNSFNFDYRSEGYFDGQGKGYQNALNLKKIRDQLRINRIGIITYTIRLDPNIPIEPYSKDVTQANDKFEVTIDRQHLYPVGFTNGQYYYIERNGHPLKLKADVYSGGNGGYHLSDILGILVAEQIRFNTFKFAIQQNRYGTRDNFEFLKKYVYSYKNWQSENMKDKDVKILVRHPKYPPN